MDADARAIRAAHAAWIAAVNGGELARLLASMTDDAVFLNPGRPPVGRDDFHVGFTAAHAAFRIRCTSDIDELTVVGDLAYTRCRDSLALTPRDGGAEIALAGHRLTIYRKRNDGRWLLARDAHTLAPVAPTGEPG